MIEKNYGKSGKISKLNMVIGKLINNIYELKDQWRLSS